MFIDCVGRYVIRNRKKPAAFALGIVSFYSEEKKVIEDNNIGHADFLRPIVEKRNREIFNERFFFGKWLWSTLDFFFGHPRHGWIDRYLFLADWEVYKIDKKTIYFYSEGINNSKHSDITFFVASAATLVHSMPVSIFLFLSGDGLDMEKAAFNHIERIVRKIHKINA